MFGSHRLSSYIELTKPKVVALIVFTAIVGMILPANSQTPISLYFFAILGITLASASAACLNQIFDNKIDATMKRTMARPIPNGLPVLNALIFALFLCILSMYILFYWVNPITAGLTFFGLVGYAFIYTLYLKYATPQNIVIGGFSGAIPPVLGWSAVTNTFAPESWLLFLIIFVWTPPHFWALAIAREKEYSKAMIPMLPVTHGITFTKLHIVLYSLLLFAVSLLPFAVKMSGIFYFVCVILLNFWYLYTVYKLYFSEDILVYRQCFNCSIYYLMFLFTSLILDKFLI